MGRASVVGGLVLVAGFGLWAAPGARADDFVPGSGEASAVVLHAGPIGSNLRATINYGESLADFGGTVGRAQSATADLGLFGLLMTTPLCPGEPPAVNRKDLPPMAYARTGDPGADNGHHVTAAGTAPESPLRVSVGDEYASATAAPEGRAITTLTGLGSEKAVWLSGGRTETRARVTGHAGRESRATTEVGVLDIAGGLVHLEHLRWEAVQHSDATGKVDRATGGFTVARVSVRGVAVAPTTPEGIPSMDIVNTALASTGMRLASPHVSVNDGVVTVSPLSVDFIDSPAARATVGVLLNSLNPVRQPVGDAVSNADCNAALAWELVDIGSAGLGGNGSFLFDVGGATAGTEANRYANPLLAPGLGIDGAVPPAVPEGGLSPALVVPGAQVPTITSTGESGLPPTGGPLARARHAASTPSIPVVGRAAGIVAGAIGVIAVIGLGVADWASLRRGARRAS